MKTTPAKTTTAKKSKPYAPGTRGTALVTGGAARLGANMVRVLGDMGYNLAIHANKSEAKAQALADELGRSGCKTAVFLCDLRQPKQAEAMIDDIAEQLGPLNVLINSASMFVNDTAQDASLADIEANIAVHLTSPWVMSLAMARQKLTNDVDQHRSIINIIDQRVFNPSPGYLSYGVSKAALLGLTKQLALELAPRIRVNGIAPGPTLPPPGTAAEKFEAHIAAMPMGHGSSPDQISLTMKYLLEAWSVTGQIICSDGGQHMGHLTMGEARRLFGG